MNNAEIFLIGLINAQGPHLAGLKKSQVTDLLYLSETPTESDSVEIVLHHGWKVSSCGEYSEDYYSTSADEVASYPNKRKLTYEFFANGVVVITLNDNEGEIIFNAVEG